jgi:hypothetical protein
MFEYIDFPVKTHGHQTFIRLVCVGMQFNVTGHIITGRDAALPKLVKIMLGNRLAENGINLQGMAIFHTAVSGAGIGPTSSNKFDIESHIVELSCILHSKEPCCPPKLMALNRIMGGSKLRYGWLNLGIQVAQNQNIIQLSKARVMMHNGKGSLKAVRV